MPKLITPFQPVETSFCQRKDEFFMCHRHTREHVWLKNTKIINDWKIENEFSFFRWFKMWYPNHFPDPFGVRKIKRTKLSDDPNRTIAKPLGAYKQSGITGIIHTNDGGDLSHAHRTCRRGARKAPQLCPRLRLQPGGAFLWTRLPPGRFRFPF